MSSNRLLNSTRFSRGAIAVLVIWVISAAFGIYLLTRFDNLVHSQLYNFGLNFDHAWADSYYLYTQLMYIALGVPMFLSVLVIAAGFKREKGTPSESRLKVTQPQLQPVACEERKGKDDESNGTGITCPSCKKVFSRPLVMLNFESGKNRLVNVCPYCSHVLGSAENEQKPKSDFQIADMDKKLTQ